MSTLPSGLPFDEFGEFDEVAGLQSSFESYPDTDEQPEPYDMQNWEAEGRDLAKQDSDVRFKLGDWLLRGEPHYIPEPTESNMNPVMKQGFYTYASRITGLAN